MKKSDPDTHQIKVPNPGPYQGDKSNSDPDQQQGVADPQRSRIRNKVMRIRNTG
jgi:hypothetical protein